MGKTDTMPGHQTQTWLLTGETGIFEGQCAEFCGTQHANMLFRVIVQSPEDFQAWLATQAAPPVERTPGTAGRTRQTNLARPKFKCLGCHAIQGTQSSRRYRSELDDFASRDCFAGCMYETTTDQPDKLADRSEGNEARKPDGNRSRDLEPGDPIIRSHLIK